MRTILICKCSTWNTLKTKNPQKTNFADFFLFQIIFKKTKKKLDFFKFLARARQYKVNNQCPFGPQKCVTGIGANGRVFSEFWRGGASSSTTMKCQVPSARFLRLFWNEKV